jgi:hypothetical protein
MERRLRVQGVGRLIRRDAFGQIWAQIAVYYLLR